MGRNSGKSSGANRNGGPVAVRNGYGARADQKRIKLEILVFGWVIVLVIAAALIVP